VRLVICLPTYNERANLEPIAHRLGDVLGSVDAEPRLLVIDDSSPDGTGELADRLSGELAFLSVLHRTRKEGLGPAYIAGFRWALDHGADRIVQMDADFSHDPAQLPALLAAAERADVVIGSRYVAGGGVVNWKKRRQLLSRFANAYVRAITHVAARDCTSGYRCWRREALESLPLDAFVSDGYSFLVEMLFTAARQGRRIVEVPITYVERREGQSKMSRAVIVESAIMPWRLIAAPKRARPTAR